jgi:hypothetical protein
MSKEVKIDPSLVQEKMPEDEKTLNQIASVDQSKDIVKGIFLLILVVAGNFVGETLGCQTQKIMMENMYVKQALVLMLIYFTINFTLSDNPHPAAMVRTTFIIWFMYLMFVRMDYGPTLAAIILLMVYYVLSNFTDYYTSLYTKKIANAKSLKEKKELEQDYYVVEQQYHNLREYTLYILIIVVIFGFIIYAKEKWDEYHDEFSIQKFIFGTGHCKGIEHHDEIQIAN